MRAGQSLPPLLWPLTFVICLAFGGAALMLGMDAGWALRNHHFYNGWAFLNGMLGRDILVAQVDGFLNPVPDVVFAFLATRLPAMALGFVLGMLHGLAFPLLFAIGWRTLEVRNPNRRILIAGGLALAGTVGSAGLGMVGTAMLHNLISLGILVTVLLAVTFWDDMAEGAPMPAAILAVLAGLPTGVAVGLDEPFIIFAIGLCAGFLFTNLPAMRRMWLIVWMAVGVIFGLLAVGGHWLASLWAAYGNPVFPFFNNIFHSPWGAADSYLHPPHQPDGAWDTIAFAFSFAFRPELAADVPFRDYRIFAVVALVPLAAVASMMKRDRDPGVITVPGPTGWLMAACLMAFALWAALLADYRVLVPLEMLAPFVIVAAVGCLPMHRSARRGLGGMIVLATVVTTLPAQWPRVAWQDTAVSATIPPVAAPADTLVLMSGTDALSFLVPLFPADMKGFWRIGSRFILPQSDDHGFAKVFRDGIAVHDGAFRSLHAVAEEESASLALAQYGLELDKTDCPSIHSPIGPGAYAWCAVRRVAGEEPAAETPPAE